MSSDKSFEWKFHFSTKSASSFVAKRNIYVLMSQRRKAKRFLTYRNNCKKKPVFPHSLIHCICSILFVDISSFCNLTIGLEIGKESFIGLLWMSNKCSHANFIQKFHFFYLNFFKKSKSDFIFLLTKLEKLFVEQLREKILADWLAGWLPSPFQ